MSEEGSVTRVTVSTELDVTGRQAQFGRGVMADVAGTLTNQFAACLAEQIRSPGAPAAAPNGSGQTAAPAQVPAQESPAMPRSPAPQVATAQMPSAQAPEALDLVSTAVQPFMKHAAPVAAGLAAGLILGLLFGHRRRIELVIAPMPQKVVPRTRATL
jgi:hypothetical protein